MILPTTEGIVFVNPLRVLPKRCFRTLSKGRYRIWVIQQNVTGNS
jgi:hypothetical protein